MFGVREDMRGEPLIKPADEYPHEHLHFLAYAACQFKPMFKEYLDAVVERHTKETGVPLRYHIPQGCSHEDDYDGIWQVENIDDFPDIVASMGFGDFFRKPFVERFVNKGYFRSAWTGKVNEPFEHAGFRDPDGWYTLYSVFPYVMLVDTRKLDGRPAPRVWSDLLHPQFRDSVMINGSDGLVSEIPLFYFFKEHGEEGLIRLAANIRESRHPAEMVRAASSSSAKGTPVYIIPWFFAQARTPATGVELVWPEDGAMTSPIYMLIKESKKTELKAIIDCVTGVELGIKSAQACFPALNPEVDNKLPKNAPFKWLGWDYIKSNDMDQIRTQATEIFLNAWRSKKQ